jgi:transcriptional regulator with XRE-family HTH domain
MPAVERRRDRADRRASQLLVELGREIREARESSGLSQAAVGGAVGIIQARVSRLERGQLAAVNIRTLCRVLDAVGLEPSFRVFPAGQPLRDAGHIRLLGHLRAITSVSWTWRAEAPLPASGDLRAWDVLLSRGGLTVGVEAETRPRDVQALLRRLALKKRDGGVDRLLLVLAATRWNRMLVRANADLLRTVLPGHPSSTLRALREGRDPGDDGWVLI